MPSTALDPILIEKLGIIIDDVDKLKIIHFQERNFRHFSQAIYSEKTINYVTDIINEGFQFRPAVMHFMATDKEKIVGIISGYKNRGIISSLYVDPQYQSEGIGNKLISLFEAEVSTTDADSIMITCPPYSMDLFRENGYRPIAKIKFKGGIRVFLIRKYIRDVSLLKQYQGALKTIATYKLFSFLSRLLG